MRTFVTPQTPPDGARARSPDGLSTGGRPALIGGGGMPPTPVSAVASIGTGATARKVVFVIGAPNPKNSGIEGSRVNPVIKVPRSRIYWYQEVNR